MSAKGLSEFSGREDLDKPAADVKDEGKIEVDDEPNLEIDLVLVIWDLLLIGLSLSMEECSMWIGTPALVMGVEEVRVERSGPSSSSCCISSKIVLILISLLFPLPLAEPTLRRS